MFVNKKIKCDKYEPDSSPDAWEHYKHFYKNSNLIMDNYDFDNLSSYTNYKELGEKCGQRYNDDWYNYANKICHNKKNNRLYALDKSAKKITDCQGVEWCCATRRIAGDCDFNFNEKKCKLFKALIGDSEQAQIQLDRCKEMHHTLLNFSLMEAMGNMQAYKGSNRYDRFDYFIYMLDLYFKGISVDILSNSTTENKGELIKYLNGYKDIYEYCKMVYFITDVTFVDKIILSGKKPIVDCSDVIRYMSLAEEFWTAKEFEFLKKEFLTVGNYFNNGGEIYKRDELLRKIETDLGLDSFDGELLIDNCVKRGFIIEIDNDIYTR